MNQPDFHWFEHNKHDACEENNFNLNLNSVNHLSTETLILINIDIRLYLNEEAQPVEVLSSRWT